MIAHLSVTGSNATHFKNFIAPAQSPERFNRGFNHVCVIA
jgi:hypothetical protein